MKHLYSLVARTRGGTGLGLTNWGKHKRVEVWLGRKNNTRKKKKKHPNESPRNTFKPGLGTSWKTLLFGWWSIRGIGQFEVLKPEQSVNVDLYEQLDWVNETCPAIFNRQHKTNPAKINELWLKMLLSHPPYSPDIASSNFYLFLLLKHVRKNWKFGWCPKYHHQIFCSRTNWFLRSGIEILQTRWQKVVNNEDDYIIDK